MNELLLNVVGWTVFVTGLALSIGLHEFGHLIPAKIFGVRVPHWAIGFGPKLFSKKIGETEYALRLVPLGGFITMIGMYPPAKPGKPDENRRFGRIIAESRKAHSEHMIAGDENRTLYSKPAWQRIVIMLGGPFMNLILGLVLIVVALAGFSNQVSGPRIESISQCVDQMLDPNATCKLDSKPSPAKTAGLEPGDLVLKVDGKPVAISADYSSVLAQEPLVQHTLTVKRGQENLNLTIVPTKLTFTQTDPKTGETVNVDVTRIGVSTNIVDYSVPVPEAISSAWNGTVQTFGFIGEFPQKVYESAASLFTGSERASDSAISIVGMAQVSGEIAAADSGFGPKVQSFLYLLGSINIALFAFNLLPFPPLDGGHVAGGIYEYLKRGAYRVVGKKDPGPVDTALLAPLTQFMFLLLLGAGLLVIIADFINPITL